MRRALEFLMYLVFSVAALPLAWLGLRDIFYYRAHPEALEVRDSAPEVFAAVAAILFADVGLLIGGALALYVLWAGPRSARVNVAILVIAWLALFFLVPETPFRSFERLYWDGLPYAALVVLPWICAGVRFALKGRRPIPASNEVPRKLSA
jgi:hypothetical protein